MQDARYTYYGDGAFFYARADRIMGTRYDMIAAGLDDGDARALWEKVKTFLTEGDRIFNRFSPDSEVSEVNRLLSEGQKAPLSEVLREEIGRCLEYQRRTGGLFNITRDASSEIWLEDGQLCSNDSSANLDFGGYAKGWALKGVLELLEESGVHSAFIDFGGSSIYAMGDQPSGEGWLVDLPSPFDGHTVTSYALRDEALSTSGNTPWYSGHIMNPLSGESDVSKALTTVRCADPLDAEVLSTVYMICDQRQRQEIEMNFPEVKFEKFNL